ncbi:ATP-binding cassette domain-containing protein [Roseicyclus sp. F158]|uniref:ATP-binding cassette domain-containing protein n=1 Tax=Tropicimonas omnivorans TaxID=3075590 RepID=A0ABU3DKB9_9RHOB|nr:ATP-binding cassette domain-containing protein [Roseicyclus sp. F158]MDT0684137.1 ATP-binding cassette domain-containing protein [Roseicyclus sp. F158]
MTAPLLDRESVGYGSAAVLSSVSFSLAPGDRVVLLGRSGSGKTTLLGAIRERLERAGSRVALVPQEAGLVPTLSVLRNALMGRLDDHGTLYNLTNLVRPRARDRTAVADILEPLGLVPEIDRAVERLSGGQKQRTALARAFFRGGAYLIGDEPVSALDERQGAEVLDEIGRRFETSVLALHDVALARSFATRIVGLKGGQVMLDGAPESLSEAEIGALYAL